MKELFPKFDFKDPRLPCVVCDSCRLRITRASENPDARSLLKIPDYSKYHFQMKTRLSNYSENNDLCICTLCTEIISKKDNIVSNIANCSVKRKETKLITEKKCPKCFNLISKGVSHKCNSSSLISYISKGLKEVESEHLVCRVLKNKIKNRLNKNEQTKNTQISVALSQEHGKPMNIIVNKKNKKKHVKYLLKI